VFPRSAYPDLATFERENEVFYSNADFAARELGVEDYVHLDLPDMRLDTIPHIELNGIVEEHVGTFSLTSCTRRTRT